MAKKTEYSKYEKARVIGARALQLGMGAPPLIESDEIDPVMLAFAEFEKSAIPLVIVKRKVT